MPIRVEASEAVAPRLASAPRKRRGAKVIATRPKKSKGSSSTKPTACVVEVTFFCLELLSFVASSSCLSVFLFFFFDLHVRTYIFRRLPLHHLSSPSRMS